MPNAFSQDFCCIFGMPCPGAVVPGRIIVLLLLIPGALSQIPPGSHQWWLGNRDWSSYWCVVRREWIGMGVAGLMKLLVMKWKNSLRLAPVSLEQAESEPPSKPLWLSGHFATPIWGAAGLQETSPKSGSSSSRRTQPSGRQSRLHGELLWHGLLSWKKHVTIASDNRMLF